MVAKNRPARVLFVCEAVTLAHVTRLLVLARSLDPTRYEVHFACADRFGFAFGEETFRRWDIESIPTRQFLDSLATGKLLYDYHTLAGYAAQDRQLFEEVSPDLVVGDYRLSLAVSAPLAGVPYALLTNAYWSPNARGRYPMPDMPMVRYLGVTISNLIYQALQPAALRWHARPINRLRREHGLEQFPDIVTANTCADYTLYADVPGLIPVYDPPANHIYLGPILWSPQTTRPKWWDAVNDDLPRVYISFGTSGRAGQVEQVVEAMEGLPVSLMIATAGRIRLGRQAGNVWVSDYLPGEEAAARAALVICNGGSGTVTQALNAGVPVLGLPTNMDQYLLMRYVQKAGAGVGLRSDCASERAIRAAAETLLCDVSYRESAAAIEKEFRQYNAVERFSNLLGQWLD